MSKKKIMIVEDNPMNMILARDILIHSGYDVIETDNGSDAITKAGREKPDIILMDLNIPGVDGTKAMRVIKSTEGGRDIHIIALTSSAMKGDERRFLAEGFDGYIAKPYDIQTLLNKIRSFI